jgi:hypothetical protein
MITVVSEDNLIEAHNLEGAGDGLQRGSNPRAVARLGVQLIHPPLEGHYERCTRTDRGSTGSGKSVLLHSES